MPPVEVCPDRLRVSSSCHAANLSVSAAALSPRAVAGVRHRRTRTGAVGVNADTVCKEKKERFRQSVSQCVSPTPRSPQPPGPSSTISPSRGVRSLSLTVHFYTNVVGTLVRRRRDRWSCASSQQSSLRDPREQGLELARSLAAGRHLGRGEARREGVVDALVDDRGHRVDAVAGDGLACLFGERVDRESRGRGLTCSGTRADSDPHLTRRGRSASQRAELTITRKIEPIRTRTRRLRIQRTPRRNRCFMRSICSGVPSKT